MIFSLQARRAWIIHGFNPIAFSPETFSAMIVCSCNVFTDHDVRETLSGGENVPRTTGQVYHCLGCSAQCGRCARTIRRIMDEALGSEATCCQNVPAHR